MHIREVVSLRRLYGSRLMHIAIGRSVGFQVCSTINSCSWEEDANDVVLGTLHKQKSYLSYNFSAQIKRYRFCAIVK